MAETEKEKINEAINTAMDLEARPCTWSGKVETRELAYLVWSTCVNMPERRETLP